ncbi:MULTISPECIES: class I SAM-dependent methyltransferase [unclassified Mycobacterium]|uniref:class I SAM-dependent methyltransferase n=1 Tax=Mycobacterium sp. DL99 TaxID=2528957 RepID=UPI001080D42A|nr:class I SAM-dependent methyltransferase [Mycobacterium sp. DL99]
MAYMAPDPSDIDRMPRGGFRASCLDRLLETDRQASGALDWTSRLFNNDQRFAAIALDLVADVPDPRILELGAGPGGVSRQLLADHPSARVTVTDVDPESVARIAASDVGSHPRAEVRQMDATAIDAADGSYDLALFALSFHRLRPAQAARVFAEGTRVADTLLIIDLPRPPAPLHLLGVATMLPAAVLLPFVHDGVISSLHSYSPSALRSLARHADPSIELTLRGGLNLPQIVIARRTR